MSTSSSTTSLTEAAADDIPNGIGSTWQSHPPPATVAALDSLSPEEISARYQPFQLNSALKTKPDWVDDLELDAVTELARAFPQRLKLLVLYGSLRERSFARLTAYEAARILTRLGADVRIYDPKGLPLKDDKSDIHENVRELRALAMWSDSQFWCSPEQHGTVTAVFKNQIDWIPLSLGSVRPTQGRTLAVCQINGGSQSFNTVNVLRQLGRWMRMWTIPNQSSIPKAWTQYTDADRLIPSSNRDRLVDVCEELIKATFILNPYRNLMDNRFSEREEKRAHGRLRTQAEVEVAKLATEAERSAVAEAAKRGSEVA